MSPLSQNMVIRAAKEVEHEIPTDYLRLGSNHGMQYALRALRLLLHGTSLRRADHRRSIEPLRPNRGVRPEMDYSFRRRAADQKRYPFAGKTALLAGRNRKYHHKRLAA